MSPSPTEALPPLQRLKLGALAAVRRWRGQQGLHTVLVQPQGVWALAPGATAPSHHTSFNTWCAAHPGVDAHVLLGTALTHNLLLAPNTGAGLSTDAAGQAARQQWAPYHGAAVQSWALACSAWANRSVVSALVAPGGAAAGPALVAAWRHSAAQHAIHLHGVQPAWVAAWQALLQAEPGLAAKTHVALAWVEGQQLTWLALRSGEPVAIDTRYISAEAAAETVAALGAEHGLSPELASETRWLGHWGTPNATPALHSSGTALDWAAAHPPLHLLRVSAQRPAEGAPLGANFAPAAPRTPALLWAWALVAVLVAALSLQETHALIDQQNHIQAQIDTLAAADAKPRTRSTGKKPSSAAAQNAQQIAARLRHPWGAVLSGLEANTPAQVQWLSLDAQAARSQVLLEGSAANADDALSTADQLATEAGWRELLITRIDNPDATNPRAGFALQADLDLAQLTPALPLPSAAPAKRVAAAQVNPSGGLR